jgi:hypothetical protein
LKVLLEAATPYLGVVCVASGPALKIDDFSMLSCVRNCCFAV